MLLRILLVGSIAAVMMTMAGCTTPDPNILTLNQQNISLIELKAIIHEVIPVGVRDLSPNGREFSSEVFILQNGQFVAAKDARTRYWARILILNDARPYDLEIEVRRERRDDRDGRIKYVDAGSDVSLAGVVRTQLKERLAKRREDLNVLDDFRVF